MKWELIWVLEEINLSVVEQSIFWKLVFAKIMTYYCYIYIDLSILSASEITRMYSFIYIYCSFLHLKFPLNFNWDFKSFSLNQLWLWRDNMSGIYIHNFTRHKNTCHATLIIKWRNVSWQRMTTDEDKREYWTLLITFLT